MTSKHIFSTLPPFHHSTIFCTRRGQTFYYKHTLILRVHAASTKYTFFQGITDSTWEIPYGVKKYVHSGLLFFCSITKIHCITHEPLMPHTRQEKWYVVIASLENLSLVHLFIMIENKHDKMAKNAYTCHYTTIYWETDLKIYGKERFCFCGPSFNMLFNLAVKIDILLEMQVGPGEKETGISLATPK